MVYRKERTKKNFSLKPLVFLFTSLLFSSSVLIRPAMAINLQGTVIAVQGSDATIKVELMDPWLPTVGNMVDLIEFADGGKVSFDIGDWQITEVNGNIVKVAAYNLTPGNHPKVNMKAIIRIPPGPVHAGAAPKVIAQKLPAQAAKGKVVMTRGENVTIQLNMEQPAVTKGADVELSYSVDGEVIPIGKWRISVVNKNGTLEAEPVEVKAQPTIDMDAFIFSDTSKSAKKVDSKKRAGQPDDSAIAGDDRSRYEKACFQGNADACTDLGFLYGTGKGVALDHRRAVELYRRACDGGSDNGCTNLGVMYNKGLGVAKDPKRAYSFFEKGCHGNHAEGCTNLGHMFEQGNGVNQDYQRAAELYERGCRGGTPRGCTSLGYLNEMGKGVNQDPQRAALLYEKGCSSGEPIACANLAYFFEYGKHANPDLIKARELYEKSCKGGHARGCGNLGWMIYQGRGIEVDKIRGQQLINQACKKGHQWSCTQLKDLGN